VERTASAIVSAMARVTLARYARRLGCCGVLLLGCDTVDVGGISFSAATECMEDDECDDGIFCNGVEVCDRTRYMSRGEPPCAPDSVCREEMQLCVDAECALRGDSDGDGHDRIDCDGDDCDDGDPGRFPGNPEVCDPMDLDEDCDPSTYGARDLDGDGFDDGACCNVDREHRTCGVDCDDERSGVHPSSVEACNDVDDDCDGAVDETAIVTLYVDADGDGHGDPESAAELCADTPGHSTLANDCDDENAAIQPGAQRCLGGQSLDGVQICGADGSWVDALCSVQLVCVAQPNGTGICR